MDQLTEEQLHRYTHHIILKDIGGEGQRQLLAARVLIVGAGGLGSPAALYLAAAGVGGIGIIDDDRVELSNLQRQILYCTADLGRSKVASAADKIAALNPDVKVFAIEDRLRRENADQILSEYDFIIDASDNFDTKYLINDVCVAIGRPFSHAGVAGFKGQVFTYAPGSPCLRCIFPEPPAPGQIQHCRGAGILGAAAGVFGSIQAAEAIKSILKKDGGLRARLLSIDLIEMDFANMGVSQNPACACNFQCGPSKK
ncbi:MAG: HesA/MoeB/ThiF family protein [bacterium]